MVLDNKFYMRVIPLVVFAIVFFCFLPGKIAAQIQISGTVISSEDKEPVIGAIVQEKNGRAGTITDIDGNFSFTVEGSESVIRVTYLGMLPFEMIVGDQRSFNIVLQSSALELNEVIVVGYGTQLRSKISGSVSTISSEEIQSTPILRTEQALQGRTAGVLVSQNSGSPGSPLMVRIRGVGTINNSDPLYIVDGVPVEGIDFLNPNDIESINILKDAASAAIYGARGANGVVLINTFSGHKGRDGQVSYQSYYGLQSPWKTLNMLNAREYAILSNEAHIAAGRRPLPEFANPDALGTGTDWLGELFQTAPMMSHQLSFQGGNERSSYVLSGNIFSQDGIVGGQKSGFDRITARLNTQNKVKSWLTIGNTFNYTSLKRRFLPENNEFTTPLVRAMNMDPITPVRKADGTYAYSNYSDTDIVNPLNQIEQTHDRWNSERVVGSVFAEVRPIRGLTVRSAFSLDYTFATRNIFVPKFDLSVDPVLSDAPAGEKSLINTVAINNNTWRNWQWENVATYDVTFDRKHNMAFTLGTTALFNRFDYSGGANTNLPSNDPNDAFIANTIDPITAQSAYSGAEESALLSVFGRVNYDYRGKYLASVTLRADGSSRFGVNNRYGYFPSISTGWVLSEEDFWSSSVIHFFKLRASWGQNGNDRIGNYSFTTVVLPGQNYVFGPDNVITSGSVALRASNPDLRWETITQTDIGLDLAFLKGKLNLVSDYYIKSTSDMLYAVPVLLTAGTEPPVQNIASVRNQGWEFALNYRDFKRTFSYSFGGNISFIKNEVTDLGPGGLPVIAGRVQSANANVTRTEVGRPIGSFFGFVTDGIFQTQSEVNSHAFQSENTSPGDIRFKDLNGDGIIDEKDQTFIGSPIPKFLYGFTAEFKYKGFDLQMFWQGTYGNDIYNATVRYDFTYVNRPASSLERWTGPGTSDFEPRVNLFDPNQNARVSDRFIEDGSFIRLKNLQIGYTLPASLTQRLRLSTCRVYVSGQNMLTFTRYSGLDPEIGQIGSSLELGIDKGFYPQARIFIGGINVNF
jgi:TonB-linked SusC/RagA family outer membrane protein